MLDFVEYLSDEQLRVARVESRDEKRLTVVDNRGRTTKLHHDRIMFHHRANSEDELLQQIEQLQEQVDIPLLWETLKDGENWEQNTPQDLALLFFDNGDQLHASAIFRALTAEKLHFRRQAHRFLARTAKDIEQVCAKQASETRMAKEQEELLACLNKQQISPSLANRLEKYLRGNTDRVLRSTLENMGRSPERRAFRLLVHCGHLPATTDLEVLQANLVENHPNAVMEYIQQIVPSNTNSKCEPCMFSIDDPDTREVDDALSICESDGFFRVDVDIANVASVVKAQDPIDIEALRRAATVYLPTKTFLMLPAKISCEHCSLLQGQPRASLRTSIWFDHGGQVVKSELQCVQIEVQRRLSYEEADNLIANGTDVVSDSLRLFSKIAENLRARRIEQGAIIIRRPEWKLRVSPDGKKIDVKAIDNDSPSRSLVAEMMILTNNVAAQFAQRMAIPIIYRTQKPPTKELPALDPQDPTAFLKLRGLISPATLSLHPDSHWGLGLPLYTQSTSPLRRYADLVLQRQICAHLTASQPPYSANDLLSVLASVESTEHEMKRLEATVYQRWALEFAAQSIGNEKRGALVVGEISGGYRVQLTDCGAIGILDTSHSYQLGNMLSVCVKSVDPFRGTLRLQE
ncbi:MAG: ribonuclease catalytic domain-containing protein [Pseudomonadota bacterium]